MELMNWADQLCVKVSETDEEHKKLINIIDDIERAIQLGHDSKIIDMSLQRLFDYIQTRFVIEEQLMASDNYPGKRAHLKEHAEITAKLSQYLACNKKNRKGTALELTTVLREWLNQHTLVFDKGLGDFLATKRKYFNKPHRSIEPFKMTLYTP